MAGKIIFPKGLRQIEMPNQGYSAGEWSAFVAPPKALSLAGIKPEANDLVAIVPDHPRKVRITRFAVYVGNMIFSDVGGAAGGNAGASTVADEALTWKLVLARTDKKNDAENAVVAELSASVAAGSAGSDNPAAAALEDDDIAGTIKNKSATGISQDHPLIYTHFGFPVVPALKFSAASKGSLEESGAEDTLANRMQSKVRFYLEMRGEWTTQSNDGV